MTLTKGVYDVVKWIALIFLPAGATLYAALAPVWNWPDVQQVVVSATAVDTFLGALVGISSKGYMPPIDGHVYVSEPTPGNAVARMEFSTHPETIALGKQKYMTLRVLPDPGQETRQVQVEMPGAPKPVKSYE